MKLLYNSETPCNTDEQFYCLKCDEDNQADCLTDAQYEACDDNQVSALCALRCQKLIFDNMCFIQASICIVIKCS